MHQDQRIGSAGFLQETLEPRQFMDATPAFRSVDGTGNNLAHTEWGSTAEAFVRLVTAAYEDGLSTPAGSDRPSARETSNEIADHPDGDMVSEKSLAAMMYAWGQFLDHDLDLTNSATPSEPLNIAIPAGDPLFDPAGTGTAVLRMSRSAYAAGTGVTSPRQQLNAITAFIDGSMVYGSDTATAASLRSFLGGKLKTSAGNLLPMSGGFFAAGDVRANENPELIALQTLFVREHNRQAAALATRNPTWNDERIYQQARRLVIAEIQSITYNEFLPQLLGTNALRSYRGYNPAVNPGISNEFATAAYRLGHSMLADDIEFMDNNGNDVHDEIALADAFFNVPVVVETGIDPLLKYLASSNSEEIDNVLVDGVRNFLSIAPGVGGFDLAALNTQRGRDHGLADYNTTRVALGLPAVTSFAQVTSDPAVVATLQSLYGDVNNMDLWVAGLAEDHVGNSAVGPTFQRILVDQFTRLRDGDRFWFERDLNRSELSAVRSMSLNDIIRANSTVSNIQENVFVFDVRVSGELFNDTNGNGRQDRRERGVAGRLVNLLDADGVLVATTTTDRDGDYTFSHVQIGAYTVQADLPTGWQSTTADTRGMTVTRGQIFSNVNFGQRRGGIGGGLASAGHRGALPDTIADDLLTL